MKTSLINSYTNYDTLKKKIFFVAAKGIETDSDLLNSFFVQKIDNLQLEKELRAARSCDWLY